MGKTTHGMSKTRLYACWKNMKQRCFNKKSERYYCYGAKGISIYKEWLSFESFSSWALTSGYNDSLTIDRIDSEKNYEPNNCRWIPYSENHDLMMKDNLDKRTGIFSIQSSNKSKTTLRNRFGKQLKLEDEDGLVYSFESRGEAVDFLHKKTGRNRNSLKSHINLCLKNKSKNCSGYRIYETNIVVN